MLLSRAIARASRSDRSRISRRSSGGQPGGRHELLDGHVPVQHLVPRPPDPTHAALTERREKPVTVGDELGERVRHRVRRYPDPPTPTPSARHCPATAEFAPRTLGVMSAEEPLFRIVRGVPTAEELAALVGAIVVLPRPAQAPAPAPRPLGAQRTPPWPARAGPGARRAPASPADLDLPPSAGRGCQGSRPAVTLTQGNRVPSQVREAPMIPEEGQPAAWLRGYGGIEADIRQTPRLRRPAPDEVDEQLLAAPARHRRRHVRASCPTRPTPSSSWSTFLQAHHDTQQPPRRARCRPSHRRHRPPGRRRRIGSPPTTPTPTPSPPPASPTSNEPSPGREHRPVRPPDAARRPTPPPPTQRTGWCCRDRTGQRPHLRPHRLAADGRPQHVGLRAGPRHRRPLEAGRRLAQGLRPRPGPPRPPPGIPARPGRGLAAGDQRRRAARTSPNSTSSSTACSAPTTPPPRTTTALAAATGAIGSARAELKPAPRGVREASSSRSRRTRRLAADPKAVMGSRVRKAPGTDATWNG